ASAARPALTRTPAAQISAAPSTRNSVTVVPLHGRPIGPRRFPNAATVRYGMPVDRGCASRLRTRSPIPQHRRGPLVRREEMLHGKLRDRHVHRGTERGYRAEQDELTAAGAQAERDRRLVRRAA